MGVIMTKEVEGVTEVPKVSKKLMAAIYVNKEDITGSQNSYTSLNNEGRGYNLVDKMEVPSSYNKVIEMCRFFHDHDGLANNTITKQVDIGINGYDIHKGSCSDKDFAIYSHINQLLYEFLKKAAAEYLISGLVIPEVTWGRVTAKEITGTRLRKSYELPTDLWYRDPGVIELKKTPLPNRVVVMIKLSEEDIRFILEKGKIDEDYTATDIYEELVEKYPDYVAAVEAGKKAFILEPDVVIRRSVDSGGVYPTPYLYPALESLLHKRNLRKMDYSIAARVISAIMLVKLGNDDYPLTEDDSDAVIDIKNQMLWRNRANNIERVFQLFSNHTLDITWITPDTSALLDEGKYNAVNNDILTALGLPRVVVSGENARSGSGSSSIAMLPPLNMIESMRRDLLVFPRWLYKEIQKRNKLSGFPEPKYDPIKLLGIQELMLLGESYYEHGVISRSGWADRGGFDFNTEAVLMAEEKKLMKKLGLDEFPPAPYSPRPQGVTDKPVEDTKNEK